MIGIKAIMDQILINVIPVYLLIWIICFLINIYKSYIVMGKPVIMIV